MRDCQSDRKGTVRRAGFSYATVATRGNGQRQCLRCPGCERKAFKLYRPDPLARLRLQILPQPQHLSVQKHDARLDRLLRVPESELMHLVTEGQNLTWKLLAIRAGYIRLGLISRF